MRKQAAVTLLAVSSIFFSLARADEAADKTDSAARRTTQAVSGDRSQKVYTTEYLEKKFGEGADQPRDVYTSESLREKFGEPAAPPPEAYTNQDLAQRFGDEEPAADAESAAAVEPSAPPEPTTATTSVEPPVPADEQARIEEIDAELARLERRVLSIRNPLLAGTVPPTDRERAAEQGLDNAERLRRVEARIEELKATLETLGKPTE